MNVNIEGKKVPTSFDVFCSDCDWSGAITVQMAENFAELAVGEAITFADNNDKPHKCPSCKKGNIYGKSGKYKRNPTTNHMDRIGDYEP